MSGSQVDSFDFYELESDISERVVRDIETEISALNERRYTIEYELEQINESIQNGHEFDLDKITDVFEEVELSFPDQLAKEYKELVDFNKRISSGRTERLHQLRQNLLEEKKEIQTELEELNQKRVTSLQLLREKRTLEKFKHLQERVTEQQREVIELEQRLSHLDRASVVQREIEGLERQVKEATNEIRSQVRSGENQRYSTIRKRFSDFVDRVLGMQALIAVNINQEGNPEFNVSTIESGTVERETSEGQVSQPV